MAEKYFIIFNNFEGGGGRIEQTFNTAEEAITYAKKECWCEDIEIIKGEIVWQS